ncbi:histidine phosphatase family protein [Corynebacterium aquilae]|uniref:histidine phosphatase family protein n=1 Tax=Corynebacterium aquilae TaxID=203263 RepID=UPI000952CDF6|nr:histidine phosphatase family protein [Corynebacterium aquilae]
MTHTIIHLVATPKDFDPADPPAAAARLPKLFADHDITYVAASPQGQAQQLAHTVARTHRLTVGIDEGLMLHLGVQQPQSAWAKTFASPFGAEPLHAVLNRVMDAVERAHLEADGHEAVLFSHPSTITVVRHHIRNSLGPRPRLTKLVAPASVTSVVMQDEKIIHTSYSH